MQPAVSRQLWSLLLVPEQHLRQLDEIPPPNHWGVPTGSFNEPDLNTFRLQPGPELAVVVDQTIFRSAREPKQSYPRGRFRVQRRKPIRTEWS